MLLQNKIILLILKFILFQSCGCSNQINPSTKEEMVSGLEKAKKDEKKLEKELRIIQDVNEGLKLAQKEDKPILLTFTGYGVINSRKLESEVILKNEKIFSLMKDEFINVWLYVDDRNGNGKKISNGVKMDSTYINGTTFDILLFNN